MISPKNIIGNKLNLNVSNVNFKGVSYKKILYPFKIIYSIEARKKISKIIKKPFLDLIRKILTIINNIL